MMPRSVDAETLAFSYFEIHKKMSTTPWIFSHQTIHAIEARPGFEINRPCTRFMPRLRKKNFKMLKISCTPGYS